MASTHLNFLLLSSFFFIFFTITFPSFIFFVHGDSSLIEVTCKTTKYYDLCLSSLKSNITSLKADSKGLALIMVQVAIANATATNSILSTQLSTSPNDNKTMKKLMKDCGDEYSYAVDALKSAAQDLGNESYDSAYIHVMAAADYPNACHNGFKRYPSLLYPSQLAQREDGLKRICDVVMGIIDNLAS